MEWVKVPSHVDLKGNEEADVLACDLHVHTDSKSSYAIILRIKQYHDRQWRTSTRQKLMHCDIWAMVYEVLQQHPGRTPWSHQYGHNQCPN